MLLRMFDQPKPGSILAAPPEEEAAARNVKRIRFAKGQVVFKEDDTASAAFLIQSGSIGIFKNMDGEQVQLATLLPGHLFGEMALIDGSTRMATAIALEDTMVALIPASTFKRNLDRTTAFVKALLRSEAVKLRGAFKPLIKRPRSFRDHVNLAQMCMDTLRVQYDYIEYKGDGAALMRTIDEAIAIIEKLGDACDAIEDRRNDVIDREDI